MRTSKSTSVSLAIVLAVTAAVLTVGFPTAGASTAACGSACVSPSVQSLGASQVLTVSGTNVVMAAASSTNTGQDWTPEDEAAVSSGISAGVVPARLGMQYGITDSLYEFQWAPGGKPSDECLSANYDNIEDDYDVGLYQCGISVDTLWIPDGLGSNGYIDLISAGAEFTVSNNDGGTTQDVPFAEPGVLTASTGGQLSIAALSELGGVVSPSQNWSTSFESAPAVVKEQARIKAEAARS